MLNGAYHYLDLVPKGRDEDGLKFSMSGYGGTISIESMYGRDPEITAQSL